MNEPDLPSRESLTAIQEETRGEAAVVQVLKKEASEIGFMTVARAKARLAAYEKVVGAYTNYIENQAELLQSGVFAATPFKELGIARLIAQWVVESEEFFKEAEPLLSQTERAVRKGYMEESFERLPDDIKARLLEEFNRRKQELLVWFVGRVQQALSEAAGADVK